MRLGQRLILILAVVAVVPILVVGVMATQGSRQALEAQIHAGQQGAAQGIAQSTDLWLRQVLARLRLSSTVFDLARMEEATRTGALRVVYRQLDEIDILVLLDERGEEAAPAVFLTDTEVEGTRLPVTEEELSIFLQAVPLAEAKALGAKVGRPYLSQRKHVVLVPVAIRIETGGAPLFLAAELVLRPVQALVSRVPAAKMGTAFVVDKEGRILAHPDGDQFLRLASDETRAVVAGQKAGKYRTQVDGEAWLGASAPLESVDWVAVVEQPEKTAFAPVRAIVRRIGVVLGAALLFAVVVGVWMSRGISGPLASVVQGAVAIAGGDLTQRLPASGAKEVQELADAFNHMSEELARSRAEIEGFNQELQTRVDERTADLKKAQQQLLQSRKLAAIGELGAGVAHELNNPLTGILGMAQIMMRKRKEGDRELKFLQRIEEDAKRCREITMNLLKFSEQQEHAVLVDSDLNEIARSAGGIRLEAMAVKSIELIYDLAEDLPRVRADHGQMQQVIMSLLSNATNASSEGGKVRLETGTDGPFVFVRVRDTGHGIPKENQSRVFEPFFTTKDDWRGSGLGLSVAYQIVQSHHGTIGIESEEGSGTLVTVSLPLPVKPVRRGPAAVGHDLG